MSAMKEDVMEVETGSNVLCEKSNIMDTTEPDKNVMASGTAGSVTCSLHPLVIMNVSEHWTRSRAQNSKTLRGKKIDITSYVEIKLFLNFSYRCFNR